MAHSLLMCSDASVESSVMLLTTTAISSADGAVRQTPTFPRGRFEKRLLVSSTDSAVRQTPTFPRGRFEKKLLIFMERIFVTVARSGLLF
eukprot:721640-Prymnesium_polylepis.3